MQLIDVRPETSFNKGSIPKSKHLAYTEVMSNHCVKDVREIMDAFKKAGIDTSKPMIFTGGAPACAVKAAADHIGLLGSRKLFEVSYNDWIKENPQTELKNDAKTETKAETKAEAPK